MVPLLVGPFTPWATQTVTDVVDDWTRPVWPPTGPLSGPAVGWDQGDFNGDGIVNDTDASIMGANWMFSIAPPPPAEQTPSVPEPSSIALLGHPRVAGGGWLGTTSLRIGRSRNVL